MMSSEAMKQQLDWRLCLRYSRMARELDGQLVPLNSKNNKKYMNKPD